jgi:hypothetical protein
MSTSEESTILPKSHLQVADLAFAALTSEPRLLSLDCAELAGRLPDGHTLGLPKGRVLLSDLREWTKGHKDDYPALNAIWRELVDRARTLRGEWLLAAVGMAMPGLVHHAVELCRDFDGDPADIDAAIVEGFLQALLRRVDLAERGLYAKLCWAGFRAGHGVRFADVDIEYRDDLETTAIAPQRPYNHVDILLNRAIRLEIIDRADADLITDTRLEYRPIELVAEATGVEVDTLRRRRERAGQRLAEALAEGHLSGPVSAPARDQLAQQARRRRAIAAATTPAAA